MNASPTPNRDTVPFLFILGDLSEVTDNLEKDGEGFLLPITTLPPEPAFPSRRGLSEKIAMYVCSGMGIKIVSESEHVVASLNCQRHSEGGIRV
jgi:hypothetical protein